MAAQAANQTQVRRIETAYLTGATFTSIDYKTGQNKDGAKYDKLSVVSNSPQGQPPSSWLMQLSKGAKNTIGITLNGKKGMSITTKLPNAQADALINAFLQEVRVDGYDFPIRAIESNLRRGGSAMLAIMFDVMLNLDVVVTDDRFTTSGATYADVTPRDWVDSYFAVSNRHGFEPEVLRDFQMMMSRNSVYLGDALEAYNREMKQTAVIIDPNDPKVLSLPAATREVINLTEPVKADMVDVSQMDPRDQDFLEDMAKKPLEEAASDPEAGVDPVATLPAPEPKAPEQDASGNGKRKAAK